MEKIDLQILHGNKIYSPAVKEGLTVETVRQGTAGKMKFSVLKDEFLNFTEGDNVVLKVGETDFFNGYVFTKKRNNNREIDVIAFDQLRYLKNKDSISFKKLAASGIVKKIAQDFNLKVGSIEDTKYTIANLTETNEELFQMIQNALDMTMDNTKKIYTLYDDFGKITLKSLDNMVVPIIIDESDGSSFDYESSIDNDTFNRIVLEYKDEEKGESTFFQANDENNIKKWGVLQKYDTVKKGENAQEKAKSLLELHNKKTRKLSVKEVIGDVRVRAGSLVYVQLNLGDLNATNLMLVEKCTHIFKNNEHLMSLNLRGGDFIA